MLVGVIHASPPVTLLSQGCHFTGIFMLKLLKLTVFAIANISLIVNGFMNSCMATAILRGKKRKLKVMLRGSPRHMSLSDTLAASLHAETQQPFRFHIKVPGTCSKLWYNSTVNEKFLGDHIQGRGGEVGKHEDATREESDSQ